MGAVVYATEENFKAEIIDSKLPVLVDFWAEWCTPCRMIAPLVEALADEYAGKVKVVKADVDNCGSFSSQFGVNSIPTLILFKNGQPMETIVGAVPKARIKTLMDSAIE